MASVTLGRIEKFDSSWEEWLQYSGEGACQARTKLLEELLQKLEQHYSPRPSEIVQIALIV